MIAATNPFIEQLPVIVEEALPVKNNGSWWMKDQQGRGVQLQTTPEKFWKLLSISGGNPLTVFLVGRGHVFEPLGAWHHRQYKIL